jgi:hypothetical protein
MYSCVIVMHSFLTGFCPSVCIRMYCCVIVMHSFLTLLSDFTNFVFEDGALWVRNRHVHIAKRRWIWRRCFVIRILFPEMHFFLLNVEGNTGIIRMQKNTFYSIGIVSSLQHQFIVHSFFFHQYWILSSVQEIWEFGILSCSDIVCMCVHTMTNSGF